MLCSRPSPETLGGGLRRLQRRRRRLTAAAALLLGTLAAMAVCLARSEASPNGDPSDDVILSESFVLKTPQGDTRAVFACDEQGNPFLEFRDRQGARRISLRYDGTKDASELVLRDRNGRAQIGQFCEGPVAGVVMREEGVDAGRSRSLALMSVGDGTDGGCLLIRGEGDKPWLQLKTQGGAGAVTLEGPQGSDPVTVPQQ